jgi:3-methyl-2-oxobutanoate hydroxymethyltransferase
MASPLSKKFTLNDLRRARVDGTKVPMLTCYDFTTARVMQEAGVPTLLVGDSAANVILGHETTLPVPLRFMVQISSAVRRGAPLAFVVADMPFGSYQGSVARGTRNVCRMVQLSGCDCVKLEVAAGHVPLVQELSDAGVAVMAHIGLRPQAVGLIGGYRYQGRSAREAEAIVSLALRMQDAGAATILLEAVPPEVAKRVVDRTVLPVIGCGAGPHCHGSVIVTHDGVGLTAHRPRFAPELGDLARPMRNAFAAYVDRVRSGSYPAAEHQYEMLAEERKSFEKTND